MTKLIWDQVGERFYETGIERGVLYTELNNGVPWNGLTAVTETPTQGSVTFGYEDGIRRAIFVQAKEFGATLEAFTYPDEFTKCEGSSDLFEGLLVDEQPPMPFGLSYQTKIGNDVEGLEHGYKLHLVYNAYATPSQRAYLSTDNTPDALKFSWSIQSVPVSTPGHRASSHFVVDSTVTAPKIMQQLENILYGTPTSNSRLPSLTELVNLFAELTDLIVIDYGDGTYSVEGPGVVELFDYRFSILHNRVTDNDDGSFDITY